MSDTKKMDWLDSLQTNVAKAWAWLNGGEDPE
jgi:hypothetical protein